MEYAGSSPVRGSSFGVRMQYLWYIIPGLYLLIALFLIVRVAPQQSSTPALIAVIIMLLLWPLTLVWFLWDWARGRVA